MFPQCQIDMHITHQRDITGVPSMCVFTATAQGVNDGPSSNSTFSTAFQTGRTVL